MNQYTKLIIEGIEVDLFESEALPLSITKRINNLDGEVQGDFSRVSVKIPATKKNVNLLGRSRALFKFRIEVDGSPNFSGLAQARRGKTQRNGYITIENSYELNLISNNSTWFNLLGDTLLSDCTDLVIPWDETYVSTGFSNPNHINYFGFMLIKWREWETWTGSYYGIKYQESTPGLMIVPLIRNAFALIGYTVVSDFFDTPDIQKLILPTPIPKKLGTDFGDKYLNTKVSFSTPITLPSITSPTNIPFTTIDVAAPSNPTAYDNVTNFEYTAPLTGYYEVELLLIFSTTSIPVGYTFLTKLRVNGVDVSPPIGFLIYSTVGYTPYPPNGEPQRATTVVFLNAGDTIAFYWSNLDAVYDITVDSGYFKITGEATKEWGMPIDFKFLLKDWRFLDMLVGLKAIFNLGFESDDNLKTVRIEPLDRYQHKCKYISNTFPTPINESKEGFYKDSETKDYSSLIDGDKDGRFDLIATAGTHRFKWPESGEETEEWLEGVNNLKIYEAHYLMGNGADASEKEDFEVPFFVKTIHVSDVLATYPNTRIAPQFPLIYSKNYVLDPTAEEADVDYDIEPRIMYHMGRRVYLATDESDGVFELYNDATLIGISRVPATFMVNYNDTTGLDPSLSFANEVNNGQEVTGLLQKYHLQNTLRKETGEVVENYVRFNSIDNNNFTFRIKAIIDSQKYIVQEIEGFNPLVDSPTNFKFYLDVHPTLSDIDNIQNTTLKGVASLLSV